MYFGSSSDWVESTGDNIQLEKLPSIEVRRTALAWPWHMTSDRDLQSPASYGPDQVTCKSSRSDQSMLKIPWKNGQTDGGNCITSLANMVSNVSGRFAAVNMAVNFIVLWSPVVSVFLCEIRGIDVVVLNDWRRKERSLFGLGLSDNTRVLSRWWYCRPEV